VYGFVIKKQRAKWWVWRFEPIQGESIDFSSCEGILIYYCGPKFSVILLGNSKDIELVIRQEPDLLW